MKNNLKIVAIGGGTGLPTVLRGLKKYTSDVTAIVTVTDSGRSSGILRKEFNMLPPGDIRNCLIALSESEESLKNLFSYRFANGSLEGHNFGNILIAALTKTTGSFEKAIEEASRILKVRGRVLPSTLENVHINAELENGMILKEENEIVRGAMGSSESNELSQELSQRSKIKNVFLNPHKAEACPETLDTIKHADVIVIGPGSLFTSIITNLLVHGIPEAIQESKAKKVYVCNIMTQQGQTDGFDVFAHLAEIEKYLGKDVLDYVIVNNNFPLHEFLEPYEKEHAFLVQINEDKLKEFKARTIKSDILQEDIEKKAAFNRREYMRHDPEKLAKVIMDLT